MVTKKIDPETLDREWIELMKEAKKSNYTPEEIREFLQKSAKENS
jgi:hypothetical protein